MMKRNNNRSKTRLMDLPIETIIDILKRLPVKSVCCIRCVSKTLSEIVYSPFFVDLLTRFQIPTNSLAGAAPQLVLRHAIYRSSRITRKRLTAFESLTYDNSEGVLTLSVISCKSHQEDYSDVSFVFYDLIFYRQVGKVINWFLINPLRGEFLRIPTSNILYTKFGKAPTFGFDCYGMGFDDITSTYKIIRVSAVYKSPIQKYTKCYLVAQLLVLGTSSWREVPISSDPNRVTFSPTKNVCAYGDVHWLLFTEEGDPAGENHIISFDSRKEEFYFTPIPVTSQMPYLHLITLGEAIALVDTFSRTKIEIWVMKDYNKREWNLEHVITSEILGLDLVFRFHRANCGEMECGIYFIDQDGEKLLFVDLRLSSMKWITYPISKKGCRRIISLKMSLISLKRFGNLVEDPKSLELHFA